MDIPAAHAELPETGEVAWLRGSSPSARSHGLT
jgi:hypothetical protein